MDLQSIEQRTEKDMLDGVSRHFIGKAVKVLKRGGIVAFPTETYYGLAVDPLKTDALARLFRVKKRKTDKPILILIHHKSQLPLLVRDIPSQFLALIDHFWPGPLTLVFDAHEILPVLLTGNTGTVGVRISSHPLARLLVEAFGKPITATSANISGLAPAENTREINRQFGMDIDMVLDGGETVGGAGSTIVGLRDNRLSLIRSGAIPFEEITCVT